MSPSSNVSTPLQPENIKGGDATECTLSQLSNIAVELLNGRVDCGFNTSTSTCPKQPDGSKTKIDFQQEILVSQILPLKFPPELVWLLGTRWYLSTEACHVWTLLWSGMTN